MSSFNSSVAERVLIVTVTATLATGLFLYMKRRKSGNLPEPTIVESSTNFHNARNASWLSFGYLNTLASHSGDVNDVDLHPEGPNIGFQSNSSWYREKSSITAKTDLLHTGHIKGGKLLIVMIGLPGRGKTYIARKVARYLRWISYRTRAFSLAKYRLDKLGSKTADFFDPTSPNSYAQRINILTLALEDSIRYLKRGGEIVILDGTNTTKDRRDIIRERVAKEDGYDILWIESINDIADDIDNHQLEELKNSPDFVDKDDYYKRLSYYKSTYETLEDSEGSIVKVYNDGMKLTIHGIHGFLKTKVVSFVMNLHTVPRPVYLVRHGESVFNVRGLVGGDSSLTPRGLAFAKALNQFLITEEMNEVDVADKLNVWSSTLRRARETAAEVKGKRYVEWRALREIETGVCDGLSYEQVKIRFPEEYQARSQDKLRYRYPRGESYLDVISRLEPVLYELERQQDPIIIVGHQAAIRCLYAYFLDLPADEIPYLSIPLHTVIKLEAKAYGCKEKRMRIVVNEDDHNN